MYAAIAPALACAAAATVERLLPLASLLPAAPTGALQRAESAPPGLS
jgi:hypothetical protein